MHACTPVLFIGSSVSLSPPLSLTLSLTPPLSHPLRVQGPESSTDHRPQGGRAVPEPQRLPPVRDDLRQLPQATGLLLGRGDEREAVLCSPGGKALFPSLLKIDPVLVWFDRHRVQTLSCATNRILRVQSCVKKKINSITYLICCSPNFVFPWHKNSRRWQKAYNYYSWFWRVFFPSIWSYLSSAISLWQLSLH